MIAVHGVDMATLSTISSFLFLSSFPTTTKKNGVQRAKITTATAAIKLQHKEEQNNNDLDSNVFTTIFSALQSCTNVAQVKQIHANIFKCGSGENIFLASKLLYLYGMFGRMDDARLLFNKMRNPNRFLWNTIIKICANNGLWEETLTLYKQMQCAYIKPDEFTFPFVIKACAGISDVQEGKEIHEIAVRNGLESHVFVASSLINMYAKCGCIEDARQVFDRMSQRNLMLWASMIAGYVEVGDGFTALVLFQEMLLKGVEVDSPCIAAGLRACALIRALQHGKSIHAHMIKSGFESSLVVDTALVNMYAKCGSIYVAHRLFGELPNRDAFLWNTMIAACAQNGHAKEAMEIFCEMRQAGMKLNSYTLAGMIPAFAHFESVKQGKCIHAYVIRGGFESNTYIATALIDMYARCGGIGIARKVFDKISERDAASWTAMIAAYGRHGNGKRALAVFIEMQEAGVKPDHVTFVSVLSACSHAGLVDEGWQYFDQMSSKFNIQATVKHYTCMVNLLGRAGRFEEAYDFIIKMHLEPHAPVWDALLCACEIYCNIELAEVAADHLYKLEPKNRAWYSLLSNIYAAVGLWDDVENVRRRMEDQGLRK